MTDSFAKENQSTLEGDRRFWAINGFAYCHFHRLNNCKQFKSLPPICCCKMIQSDAKCYHSIERENAGAGKRESGHYGTDTSYQSNIIRHYNKWAIIGIVLSITWICICNWLLGMMTLWFSHLARLWYQFWLPTGMVSYTYICMCIHVYTHAEQPWSKHNYLKMILLKQ